MDPAELQKLRDECRAEWATKFTDRASYQPLRGGPLDGMAVPHLPGDALWHGPWVNDEGDVVQLCYEWVLDDGGTWHGERAGTVNTTEQATEVAEEFFAQARGEADEPMVDLDQLSVADQLAFLRTDNERRCAALSEQSDGQIDLAHSFDVSFVRIFVDRILCFMSPKIHEEACLEYENERSQTIDELEDKFTKFVEQRDAAIARQQLMSQFPPPAAGPVHQGRVTLPPRRVRRGN